MENGHTNTLQYGHKWTNSVATQTFLRRHAVGSHPTSRIVTREKHETTRAWTFGPCQPPKSRRELYYFNPPPLYKKYLYKKRAPGFGF